MGPSAESEVEPHERRALPCQLGRFTLLREVGAGGMATVYLGTMQLAEGLERLVAIKTIHPELADQDAFVDMFLDEARIASLISHPNVCSVHDFGQAEHTYYLAMEYLLGEPVSEIIREVWEHRKDAAMMQTLPYLAARIVADACEGLHAAHETKGAGGQRLEVVHRDVSPQNLFVTYDGAVKVVDFGCAKALQRITETSAGIFKGKVAYAAPEQLRIQQLDARTDVWALGAVLWELLTLERVFKRESPMKTARAILEQPIPRVDAINPEVPPALADIVERALTRSPVGRYQSARDMGRALRTFIAGAGATFESAEIAEWMSFLFATRRGDRLRIAREVEASLASHVIAVGGPLSLSRTVSKEEPPTLEAPLEESSDVMAVPTSPYVAPFEDETTTMAERSSRPPSRRLRLDAADRLEGRPRERGSRTALVALALGIVLSAVAIGAWLAFGGPADTESSVVAGQGVVIIESAGGEAEVFRDGVSLGHTPLTVELPAGRQRLTFSGFGRDLREEVVVPVEAGATARVTVRPR